MISIDKVQVATVLYRAIRSDRFSAADLELSEEKAEDILSFCSIGVLQLCLQQLIVKEDYERCTMLQELIIEKSLQDYSEAWETC